MALKGCMGRSKSIGDLSEPPRSIRLRNQMSGCRLQEFIPPDTNSQRITVDLAQIGFFEHKKKLNNSLTIAGGDSFPKEVDLVNSDELTCLIDSFHPIVNDPLSTSQINSLLSDLDTAKEDKDVNLSIIDDFLRSVGQENQPINLNHDDEFESFLNGLTSSSIGNPLSMEVDGQNVNSQPTNIVASSQLNSQLGDSALQSSNIQLGGQLTQTPSNNHFVVRSFKLPSLNRSFRNNNRTSALPSSRPEQASGSSHRPSKFDKIVRNNELQYFHYINNHLQTHEEYLLSKSSAKSVRSTNNQIGTDDLEKGCNNPLDNCSESFTRTVNKLPKKCGKAKRKSSVRNYQNKPFVCGVCNKRFRIIGHLKTHYAIHTEKIKTHPCNECDKCCCHRGALALHMRRHTLARAKGLASPNIVSSSPEWTSSNDFSIWHQEDIIPAVLPNPTTTTPSIDATQQNPVILPMPNDLPSSSSTLQLEIGNVSTEYSNDLSTMWGRNLDQSITVGPSVPEQVQPELQFDHQQPLLPAGLRNTMQRSKSKASLSPLSTSSDDFSGPSHNRPSPLAVQGPIARLPLTNLERQYQFVQSPLATTDSNFGLGSLTMSMNQSNNGIQITQPSLFNTGSQSTTISSSYHDNPMLLQNSIVHSTNELDQALIDLGSYPPIQQLETTPAAELPNNLLTALENNLELQALVTSLQSHEVIQHQQQNELQIPPGIYILEQQQSPVVQVSQQPNDVVQQQTQSQEETRSEHQQQQQMDLSLVTENEETAANQFIHTLRKNQFQQQKEVVTQPISNESGMLDSSIYTFSQPIYSPISPAEENNLDTP